MKEKRISLAFTLLVEYAERQGWIPIGHKVFTVGDWHIEVNGTREPIDNIRPFHARVQNQKYVGVMMMHPYGGSVGGYKHTERDFVAAMRGAIDALPKEKNHGGPTTGVS